MAKNIILIVDDEVNLADLLKHHLQDKGYQVVTANNGREGLEKLKTITPDLIILDVNMPEMNGLEFYRNISTEYGRARYPVLLLTERAGLEQTFQDIDAAGFMPKPYLMEDVLKEVHRILAGEKPAVFLLDFDDATHSAKISEVLSREHLDVATVTDLNQLAVICASKTPKYVLIRFVPKQIQQEGVLAKIKAIPSLRSVPVIVYSFEAFAEYDDISKKAGADRYLGNPRKYDEFMTVIRELDLQAKENKG